MGFGEHLPDGLVAVLVEGVQVAADRPREEQRVLRDDRDVLAKVVGAERRDVDAVDQNAVRVVDGDGRADVGELTAFGEIINPLGMRMIGEYPNLTAAMQARGWPDSKVQKVMGENWLRLLKEVWGA